MTPTDYSVENQGQQGSAKRKKQPPFRSYEGEEGEEKGVFAHFETAETCDRFVCWASQRQLGPFGYKCCYGKGIKLLDRSRQEVDSFVESFHVFESNPGRFD
jgi:hypothetical protein